MKPPFLALTLLIAVALLSGCLDFERETVTYHHDAKGDTLRLFLVYNGIFGADGRDGLSEQEQAQLAEMLAGDRAFFFSNWIFEYNRASLKKELENLNDPDQTRDKPNDLVVREKKFLELLLANVRVDNGPFFYDANHRLCAAQRVTVQNVTDLLRAANELMRAGLRHKAGAEGTDENERQVILKSLANEGAFLRLTGNRFSLRWPLTGEDFESSFGRGDNQQAKIILGEFNRQGGHLGWEKGEIFTHIGATNNAHTTLTLPVSGKPYKPNAVAAIALRAQLTVLEKFDAPAAAKAFVATGKVP